ncbi:MAG: hypothetical protein JO340_03655 [Acidobacteriaceae bacterium]|nr:hypothetical protein [Acidobacteriaceae bacterium]
MPSSNRNTSGNPTSAAASASVAVSVDSGACEIPAFCRSNFYTGKLLTECDLTREQRYLIDKLRLHYVALHGWGVACGLMVKPHPQYADRLVVTPGFAVDDCGREIRLLKECVVLFPKPPQSLPDPCEPEFEDEACDESGTGIEIEPERHNYYVCIRYTECREDFMPVVFSDCCNTSKQPNRISECAVIDILTDPPECLGEIQRHKQRPREENCHALLEHTSQNCPPSGKECCIPLALVHGYVYGDSLTEHMIDNRVRPHMPSVPHLEALVRCVMEHQPKHGPHLTRISRVHWEHDREYRPREFVHEFVGTHEAPRGFLVEFDKEVHEQGLNPRTFQATIVRHPYEGHEARRVEIAPARVTRGEDGRHCSLHIDPEYVRRHLQEENFDVILTLQCDKVIDENGIPVDGNLLAGVREYDKQYMLRFPTGNGTPGGLFESWIRVRRER